MLDGTWLHSADLSGCDCRGSDLAGLEPECTHIKNAIVTIDQAIVIAENLGFDVREG